MCVGGGGIECKNAKDGLHSVPPRKDVLLQYLPRSRVGTSKLLADNSRCWEIVQLLIMRRQKQPGI